MRILVTGYKGFIGSRLYEEAKNLGLDVVGIDLKDGNDIMFCLPEQKFDYVFHLAAYPSVGYSIENPFYTLRQNVLVTSKMLQWCLHHGVKRFIFSSSSAVNNGKPTSPYGAHKMMSEIECALYSKLYGLDTVCLRYYNVYSEQQQYKGVNSSVLSTWMRMIQDNKPLRIDGDGEQTRDFVHVDDIVSANLLFISNERFFGGKIFDVGTGQTVSMNRIKSIIDKKFNVDWTYTKERSGDIKHSKADIAELLSLGWCPKVSFEEGFKKCLNLAN